jgi:glycosyltransferase involved in cell wall biosynthesis
MDASIIICTYNRAESLRDTLRAIKAQQTPTSRTWEVIVVDNNSKDHTREVVEAFQKDWGRLRYEFEGKQGLSHARNFGIAAAHGDVLLFTDDDVLPEPAWMETTLSGLDKYHADACGGYIAPIWESPPPTWLTERFYGFLAIRTECDDDYDLTSSSTPPFGANMAFRRETIQKSGGFDISRGRNGNVLAGGEDSELFERIVSSGFKAVFLGKSRVHHKVESFRLTKRYFRRWRFQSSRNLAQCKDTIGGRRLFNIPLYIFPQALRAFLRMVWGYLTQPADEAFHRDMMVFHFLGMMEGLYRSRRRPSGQ